MVEPCRPPLGKHVEKCGEPDSLTPEINQSQTSFLLAELDQVSVNTLVPNLLWEVLQLPSSCQKALPLVVSQLALPWLPLSVFRTHQICSVNDVISVLISTLSHVQLSQDTQGYTKVNCVRSLFTCAQLLTLSRVTVLTLSVCHHSVHTQPAILLEKGCG